MSLATLDDSLKSGKAPEVSLKTHNAQHQSGNKNMRMTITLNFVQSQ